MEDGDATLTFKFRETPRGLVVEASGAQPFWAFLSRKAAEGRLQHSGRVLPLGNDRAASSMPWKLALGTSTGSPRSSVWVAARSITRYCGLAAVGKVANLGDGRGGRGRRQIWALTEKAG